LRVCGKVTTTISDAVRDVVVRARATPNPGDPQRLFAASDALTAALVSARGLRLDAVALLDAPMLVQRAVEGALAAWAYFAADPSQASERWLLCDDVLDDSCAAWLTRRFRAAPEAEATLLAMTRSELQQFVDAGVVERPWGELQARAEGIWARLHRAPPPNAAWPIAMAADLVADR
jgi:hypothetical protein